jgi:Mg2+-importing ATPase
MPYLTQKNLIDFQHLSPEESLREMKSSLRGLSQLESSKRLLLYGANVAEAQKKWRLLKDIIKKLFSPLVITLVIVAGFSYFFGEPISAAIIIIMAMIGTILSFLQEFKAQKNAEKLQALVHITIDVTRDGKILHLPLKQILPGDIITLSAGKMIPADIKIIEAKDLFLNQAALNGESFPVEKWVEPHLSDPKTIYDNDTIALMGASVVSGTGKGLVIFTGARTEFGKLAKDMALEAPETAFDRGIRDFTWLMIKLIFILMTFIFVVNALFKNNFVDSLLFSLAVAVGITPEMLPMIVTVNLSRGALKMAKKKVIIKRLDSIQNFGAMDILCTDKTGTLTMDEIILVKHCNIEGEEDESILRDAFINSSNQSGMNNLLDKAIIKHHSFHLKKVRLLDEIPYDFERKMVSVVVNDGDLIRLIAKGAPEEIFARSKYYELNGKKHLLDKKGIAILKKKYDEFSRDGFRVLGIAYKEAKAKDAYSQHDEADLIFRGFAAFLDPPKSTAKEAIAKMETLGIKLKILSGDNELVTEKICREVGVDGHGFLTGADVEKMNDQELGKAIEEYDIFARMMPLQKERIITALQKNGHIVGFLGDGINDAPALKAADVGISVNNAADITKNTADIILLKKSLLVLAETVVEGRKTFANTLKYIKMGASSNFGNMLSMTGASILLPFLPMLPSQILLNNFLYDMSQISTPTDNVDEEYVMKPRPWHIKFIKKFIYVIGPISSIFDFMTYGIMWFVFNGAANPAMFRTGWFVESLFTQTMIIYVIRTNKIPFIQSWPSKSVIITTLSIVAIGCILPFTPISKWFEFAPLPPLYFLLMFVLGIAYLVMTQFVKAWFIRKWGYD